MQGSVACVGSFNSCGQVCGGLNQGWPGTAQPAKAAGGVGDATITWPSAPIPRADLSQLWAHVRKQSVGGFVLKGIGFCAFLCLLFVTMAWVGESLAVSDPGAGSYWEFVDI